MKGTNVLTVLDVGHGNCTVVQGNSSAAVIDTATGSSLLEYLTDEGIDHIDIVVLSHADNDHIGGLGGVLAAGWSVDVVYVNTDSSKASAAWDDLVYELNQRDAEGETELRTSITREDALLWKDGNASLAVLGPSKYLALKGPGSRDRYGKKIRSNSVSAVVKLQWAGRNVALFPGDLDGVGLDDACADEVNLEAPIVVFPHHGGRGAGGKADGPFAERLAAVTKAESVLFSIGRNVHENPRPEVVAGVRKGAPTAAVSCTQLSVQCARRLRGHDNEHLGIAFARGRRRGLCCAGSMRFSLETGQQVSPGRDAHREFVEVSADSPMCL